MATDDGSRSMKLLFVLGTRPEAIKLAPVFLELSSRPSLDCKICVTGQHRELLADFDRRRFMTDSGGEKFHVT